jgi:hypothetical protein
LNPPDCCKIFSGNAEEGKRERESMYLIVKEVKIWLNRTFQFSFCKRISATQRDLWLFLKLFNSEINQLLH